MLTVLLLASSAHAIPLALDPQNRITLGATFLGGPSPVGISGGFESRVTRILAAEFAAFASPIPLNEDLAGGLAPAEDVYHLRHGIYGDLGFRIPHRQPKGFAWDIHFRGGGGVVWNAHVAPGAFSTSTGAYEVAPAMGAMGGGDLMFRVGHWGLRAGGKAWAFQVVDQAELATAMVVRPQISLEALFQW